MANRRRRENQVYRVDCDPEPQRANPAPARKEEIYYAITSGVPDGRRWDASRFTKVETSVPVVEEATGACGGGTAKRDLDGRSLCPLNPTPKVCNPVTGKGAVAKVTAGKGSVPDKRKSFSGRRVQGAVVKSGKGRTGTVLKNGTILHLQRVPQHLSTPPLGETAEYLAKSLLAASSSRLLAGSETKRGGKTGLLWIRREKGNGCACMKVRVSTPRGYVDKFR
ncbi:hypothetical protein MCOR27_006629 [Pyricularia oryzae]|nr:hypothetical protein MCOR27_006629 [Pyricularia oryzae]KAI6567178.1 hypothetical protein MCOR03_001146 [Pyricularia oryzae]KAI6569938.1 hypothetical protein MCOR09_005103 [Pyricularia oryzae]